MEVEYYADGGVKQAETVSLAERVHITEDDDAPSVFALRGVKFTPVGLHLPTGLPYEIWEHMMGTLDDIERGIQWCVGDALNYGERAYGEMYAQAMNITGYAYPTLSTMKWVSSVFPMESRHPALRFGHHQEVAVLYATHPAIAEEILCAAERDHLSCRQVRADVRDARHDLGLEPSVQDTDANTESDVGYHEGEPGGLYPRGGGTWSLPWSQAEKQPPDARLLWADDLLEFALRAALCTPEALPDLQQEIERWLVEHGLEDEYLGRLRDVGRRGILKE